MRTTLVQESRVTKSLLAPWTLLKLSDGKSLSYLGLKALGSWWAVSVRESPCSFTVFRKGPDKEPWSLAY